MAGAGLLALAACQGGAGRRPLPGPSVPPPRLPSGEMRNGVALIVPLSGPDSGVGQSIANAANLALLDSGDKTLRLTTYDSAGAGGAAGAANQAINAGNGLILGPLLAADALDAASVARRAGVPVIAFSNDERIAGNGVYIMGFTPGQSIDRVVRYARGKGMARFGALVPTGLYGDRVSQAMLATVRAAGGRMTGLETFNRSPSAIRAAANRLKSKGMADAVMIGDSGRIAALAAPSLGARKLLGTELWAADRTLGKTPALRGALYAAAPDARFNQLVTRYRARYGKSPYRLGSLGYDAVLLTVRSAKGWEVGRDFPARRLIDRDGFAGVDGIFRFGRDGVAQRALEVRQVTAQGSTVVSPAATAFGN